MATSIGQDAPVLPGEPPSLTGKPGRPQSTGSQRVPLGAGTQACRDTQATRYDLEGEEIQSQGGFGAAAIP